MTFQALVNYVRQLARDGRAAQDPIPEELQHPERVFALPSDELSDEDFIEQDRSLYSAISVSCQKDAVEFSAFLDGVQRTLIFRWETTSKGALVPLHLAEIAAAVIQRDANGRLRFDPAFCHHRFLVLMPWEGLKSHGLDLPKPEEAIEDTDDQVFRLASSHELIFCDTTYKGISPEVRNRRQDGLEGDRLYDFGTVRARAQTRVAVMRQVLELLVLARYRSQHPDSWVLVDGPLFLLDRWHRGDLQSPDLLRQSVGYIKSLWRRPARPDVVLSLRQDERTPVMRLRKEQRPKTGTDAQDESGVYRRPHLEWYVRMRVPPAWTAPGPEGLVRLDVEISTFGLSRGDAPDLTLQGFQKHKHLVDAITTAVWRERWPAPRTADGLRRFVELYPVFQLEQVLHASLLSRRALAYAGYR